MSLTPTDDDFETWRRYLEARRKQREAASQLLRISHDRPEALVEILRLGLNNFDDRFDVLEVVKCIAPEYQQLLVFEILPLATMNETKRSTNLAAEIVLSWPREWLNAHLEDQARAVMKAISNEAFRFTHLSEFYSGLIGMFRAVNMETADRITREAAAHADPDVRWIGNDWLKQPGFSETAI
jgi:hypothetical protein